jgi:uncharacterized repeat protein (TIGR01451 family)
MLLCSLRRSLVLTASLLAMLALAPTSASALTVTRQSATSCDSYSALTDWSRNLQLPRFNVAGGTLVAVTVSREASIRSDYRVESRNGTSRTDTLSLNDAQVRFDVPGFAPTIAQLPSGTRTYSFSAFDGTVDFGGTSGATGGFGVAQDSGAGVAPSTAGWSGTGFVTIPATSSAATSSTLSGNYRLEWDTTSDARACVTYTYTEEVLVCIGDYVWYDTDRDGVQDPGETGVAGRPISVTGPGGAVLGATTTNADGYWKVCQMEPSTPCVVSVDLPDGWSLSPAFQGGDRTIDSDAIASGADATINCITPPSGEDLTFDTGINRAPTPVDAPTPVPARLRVVKTSGSDVINSRGTVTFVVRVTNRGGLTVRDLRVCDAPPSQLAFTTRPRGATMSSGQLCWNVARLMPGRTITYRYTMRASNVAARQCVVNRATAVATVGGSAAARDTVCIRPTELGILQLAG